MRAVTLEVKKGVVAGMEEGGENGDDGPSNSEPSMGGSAEMEDAGLGDSDSSSFNDDFGQTDIAISAGISQASTCTISTKFSIHLRREMLRCFLWQVWMS